MVGGAWQGGGHVSLGACMADTTIYSDTVNERAVRILLECIFVTRYNQGGSKGLHLASTEECPRCFSFITTIVKIIVLQRCQALE